MYNGVKTLYHPIPWKSSKVMLMHSSMRGMFHHQTNKHLVITPPACPILVQGFDISVLDRPNCKKEVKSIIAAILIFVVAKRLGFLTSFRFP